MVYKNYLKIVCSLLHANHKGIYFLSNMYQLSLNQPVILQKDGMAWKDENCVDNFAANLTNRDLCLHDLNITLRIPLFNKIHSFIYWSYFIYYVHSWKKIYMLVFQSAYIDYNPNWHNIFNNVKKTVIILNQMH